ncbi:MAG: DMT family transporter [Halodesulfurarchaeum sp.]
MEARTRGVIYAIISASGFGTLAIFGRYADLLGMSLVTLLAFRFLLATPAIWLPLYATGRLRLLSGRSLAIAIGLGTVGYAAMSFFFLYGVNRTGAGLAGIILYVYPAMVVALAAVFLEERITKRTVVAVGIAILGVAIVMRGQPSRVDPVGVAVVLGAAVVYASYVTISRHVLETVDAPVLSAHVIPGAFVSFLVIGGISGSISVPSGLTAWGVVLGIAVIATAIPILSFFLAIEAIGASRTSIVSTFEPVATVVLGIVLLGEPLSVGTIVGGIAVLSGVLLVQTD